MIQMDTYNLSPFDVANWFVCNLDREAGDSITHLKLQKLLYYSQVWSIVLNKKIIFEDDFQAWAHGPVLPDVYHDYKEYGFNSIPSCECDNNIDDELEEVLKEVKRVYGEFSAKKLEDLTHSEDPWKEARGNLPSEAACNKIISKESLVSYYSKMYEEVQN